MLCSLQELVFVGFDIQTVCDFHDQRAGHAGEGLKLAFRGYYEDPFYGKHTIVRGRENRQGCQQGVRGNDRRVCVDNRQSS